MDIANKDRALDLLKARESIESKILVLKDYRAIEVVAKDPDVMSVVAYTEISCRKSPLRKFLIDMLENQIEEIDDELKTL